jgi:menaquinone-dependent protoporphyrinogen oxidase
MSKRTLSRRNFLTVAGITVGAAAVACSGLGYAATLPPEIDTPQLTYGKDNEMNKRILVTYATRAGSTGEVASAIGETLAGRGFLVEVKPIKAKPSPEGYQAVLVGSAVRMGQWLPEAVDFLKTNQSIFNSLPVGLFTVHMNNLGEADASRTQRHAYLGGVRPFVKTADEVFFAGKMDMSKLSFLDRTIARMVGSKDEDARDWNKIRVWAQTVFA